MNQGGTIVRGIATREISPGESISDTFFIHHNFTKIPPGKAKLRLCLPIINFIERNNQVEIAAPSADLEIFVSKASPEKLQALAARLTKALAVADLTFQREGEVVDTLTWTRHPALLPATFEVLKPRGNRSQHYNLRYCLATWAIESPEVRQQLV